MVLIYPLRSLPATCSCPLCLYIHWDLYLQHIAVHGADIYIHTGSSTCKMLQVVMLCSPNKSMLTVTHQLTLGHFLNYKLTWTHAASWQEWNTTNQRCLNFFFAPLTWIIIHIFFVSPYLGCVSLRLFFISSLLDLGITGSWVVCAILISVPVALFVSEDRGARIEDRGAITEER